MIDNCYTHILLAFFHVSRIPVSTRTIHTSSVQLLCNSTVANSSFRYLIVPENIKYWYYTQLVFFQSFYLIKQLHLFCSSCALLILVMYFDYLIIIFVGVIYIKISEILIKCISVTYFHHCFSSLNEKCIDLASCAAFT